MTRARPPFLIALALSAAALAAVEFASAPQTGRAASLASLEEKTAIFDARQRLGRDTPTGAGVVVGHVEPANGGETNYLPNWEDGRYRGTVFVQRSGPGKVSGHANASAKAIYGRGGLAPGVEVIHAFEASDWIGEGYLNSGTAEPPAEDLPRVWNHSWIGNPDDGAEHILARLDYQVDERDVIICAGVNNGHKSKVPALLGSAYNVIAVGHAEGKSSGGYTRLQGVGRCKPDIVAPNGLTSFATPVVTACVARLLEAADAMGDDAPRAGRAETVKAALLAGATKPEGWQPAPGKPLDEHLGAGLVNFDHAVRVLQTGPAAPGKLAHRYGWDFRALGGGEREHYRFTTTQPLDETSVVLTWHRRVAPETAEDPESGKTVWYGVPRTADFDLRLVRIIDGGRKLETVAASTSLIDNVEHIYLPALEPGEYVLEVRRQPDDHEEAWDYALAWRFEQGGRSR